MDTFYANVVNFRVTPTEFVMEFGTFFPDKPQVGPPPPSEVKIETRVVMTVNVLDGLAQAIQQAAKARQSQIVVPPKGAGGIN